MAVAAGIVPVAHGNDGGGSIRVPASANGVVGLKSSRGRISRSPILAQSWESLATQGMLTRTVRDSALTLDLLAGTMPGDPYGCPSPNQPFRDAASAGPAQLRIGLCDVNEAGPLHADCRDAVRAVGDALADLGHPARRALRRRGHPDPRSQPARRSHALAWAAPRGLGWRGVKGRVSASGHHRCGLWRGGWTSALVRVAQRCRKSRPTIPHARSQRTRPPFLPMGTHYATREKSGPAYGFFP